MNSLNFSDNPDKVYDLSSIGLENTFLCIEKDLIYIYNEDTNFYKEFGFNFIPSENKTFTLLSDDGKSLLVNEDQLIIIGEILKKSELNKIPDLSNT